MIQPLQTPIPQQWLDRLNTYTTNDAFDIVLWLTERANNYPPLESIDPEAS